MKRIDDKTTIAAAITLTIIAAAAIQFGWKLNDLHQTGWAGFAYFYQPNRDEVVDMAPMMEMFVKRDGEVTIIIPGSPADRAGIDFGDQIVSVSGIPIEEIAKLERLSERAEPGDVIEYKVRRGESTTVARVELRRISESRTQMVSFATSLITGFGFLLISVLLFTAGPRSDGAWVFFQLCIVGSLFFFFSAAFEFDMNDSQGIVSVGSQTDVVMTVLAYVILAILLSNLLLHFSLVFPKRGPVLERNPKIAWWLHVGPFALPAALIGSMLILAPVDNELFPLILISAALAMIAGILEFRKRARKLGSWKASVNASPIVALLLFIGLTLTILVTAALVGKKTFIVIFTSLMLLVMIGFLIWGMTYVLLTIANFVRSYRSSNPEERRQLRWPLWGTIVTLALVSLVGVFVVIMMASNPTTYTRDAPAFSWLGSVVKLGYLAIPISFGLGIQKYGLMQIDTILKKTFVYAIVTTIVVVTYLVVVGVLGVALVSMAGVQSQSVVVAATLLVAALFIPVRNHVQKFVDRRFFKRQQNYDDVRRSLARMTATSRNLEDFLDSAESTLREALGVPRIAIFCREASGTLLALKKAQGLPEEAGHLELSPGDPLAQPGPRVVDLNEHPSKASEALGVRYGVRLQSSEGVIGALTLSDRPRDPLAEEDLDFLGGIADQLALGISSLQIRTDDIELVQARQIQRSLLPTVVPQIRRCEIATAWIPARSVGGDYYDVLSLGEKKLGFCIGDVVGKGMPAALLMSGLQSAVRAIAPADSTPDVTVAGIRRVAAQNLTGGKFITFFYGTVDEDGNVSYTNAGHNEPVLVRADGTIERLGGTGAAIARLMVDAEFSTESVRISRGDTIVLFTDGVSEAPAANSADLEDIYGEERLVELVREHRARKPADLVGIILDEVREYAGGDFADDLTLVVIRAK